MNDKWRWRRSSRPSGEIDMVMVMDGGTVHLKTGDVLLGRGIVHNWVNTGNEPCVIAFVLVAAEPVVINSNVLVATG